MSKADGWRGKRSHFRFTSHKLRWSGSPYVHYYFIFFVFLFYPNYFHEFHLPFNIDWQRRLFARRGYSRHIALDKRVTELLAIISENAKAGEILSMIAPGSDVALGKIKWFRREKNKWFRGWSADEQLYLLQEDWWVPFLVRGKLRILKN